MKDYLFDNFHHLVHGADYSPEQWIYDKSIWDDDMKYMVEANCNEMTVGIFAWSIIEPREGEYDFSCLDEIIDKIYSHNGRVVLSTPSVARPHWLADKYPDVIRTDKKGLKEHFGRRHNYCYTSENYRKKVSEINGLLAQRYGNHPAVIAWHISNEYSGCCYCESCIRAFREFLRKKYNNDINQLNYQYWSTFWSHTYSSFEQVEPPYENGETSIAGLTLDWQRFTSYITLDFMKMEIEAIRKYNKNLPVTTNMMEKLYDLNYWEFAEHVDIISWDNYPSWHDGNNVDIACNAGFWHDLFRSLKKRPFMMMESAPGLVNWKEYNKLKRPGMEKLSAIQAVAHGSDTVQYFQWRKSRGCNEKFHGAVIDHVANSNTRVFNDVKKTGEFLKKIDFVAGTNVQSKVAIMFDWENCWALDNCQAFIRFNKGYLPTCIEYYKIFWEKGISVDFVNPDSDFSMYDLLVIPMQYMLKESSAKNIEKYVENGGNVYATYMLGMVNENDLVYMHGFPCGNLKNVFGIWNEEIDTLYPNDRGEVVYADKKYVAKDFCELIHVDTAKVLATYSKDFYLGYPALTQNQYGMGKAYYQAFRDDGAFKGEFLLKLIQELQIKGALPQATLSNGITCHKRSDEEFDIVFVENYLDTPVNSFDLGEELVDVETDKCVKAIDLGAFDVKVLYKKKA